MLAFFALAVAAAPAQAGDPVIAAAGDIACSPSHAAFNNGDGTATECRQRHTSDLLLNSPLFSGLSAVLPIGDLQYENGALSNFQASYEGSWGRLRSLSRPVIGNHESPGTGYYEYFNGPGAASGLAGPTGLGYYSYDLGTWHLIALNSNCQDVGGCHTGSPQERWLQADLAANRTSCTLAYWHEPVFSSTKISTGPGALWKTLYAAGAEVVVSGHSHNYERFAPQTPNAVGDPAYGVRQFVVGTGGRSLYAFTAVAVPNSEARIDTSFGILRIALHPASYEWQFVSEAGRVEDSGSRACHGIPPAAPARARLPSAPQPPFGGSNLQLHECTVLGTTADDLLEGTRGRDIICGRGGHDTIYGAAGDDVIVSGAGNDRVLPSSGDDSIYGDAGNDRLEGGKGRDRIDGGAGRDRLFGGRGNDRLADAGGNDRAYGNSGNDVFLSGKGRDLVDGGSGRDRARVSRHDATRRVERSLRLRRAGARADQ